MYIQWPCKGYVKEHPHKIWPCMAPPFQGSENPTGQSHWTIPLKNDIHLQSFIE